MSDELKPCPFCGGEAVHELDGGEPIIRFHYDDGCFLADGQTMYDCPSAVQAWNRRAKRTFHMEIVGTAHHSAVMCSECKHRFDDMFIYCSHCGAIYCPYCWARLEGVGR